MSFHLDYYPPLRDNQHHLQSLDKFYTQITKSSFGQRGRKLYQELGREGCEAVDSQKILIYAVLCALHVAVTDSGPCNFVVNRVFDDIFKENFVKQ